MNGRLHKLVIAGGSGFLGRLLVDWFIPLRWDVVVLTRDPCCATPARAVLWDGETVGDWTGELEGCTALVNLAGRSVNCRYHARNRRAMLRSRLDSTRVMGEAVAACAQPPTVWLNSSTATIYKHSYDRPMDEATGVIEGSPEAKDVFSVKIAQAWEAAFDEARADATRKVALRTAMVLSTEPHTVYRVLRRLVRCGLGGAMADGRQFMSWLHQTDFCRGVQWLIEHDEISGPVNLVAPQPLPNREVMRTLRAVCGVPFGLPAYRWMLEIGAVALRTETELVIKSRRVVPTRLLEAGFAFRFPDFRLAVDELEHRMADAHVAPKKQGAIHTRHRG